MTYRTHQTPNRNIQVIETFPRQNVDKINDLIDKFCMYMLSEKAVTVQYWNK